MNYRKDVVRQFLTGLDRNVPTKINVLDAMWMLTEALSNVSDTFISNCLLAKSYNVSSLDKFVENFKIMCKIVNIIPTNEAHISFYDRKLPAKLLKYKGILKLFLICLLPDLFRP